MPLVNSSYLYSVSGQQAKAEEYLEKALVHWSLTMKLPI